VLNSPGSRFGLDVIDSGAQFAFDLPSRLSLCQIGTFIDLADLLLGETKFAQAVLPFPSHRS
jgi:hypothetical protein